MKKCVENKYLSKWNILVENAIQQKPAKDFTKIKTLAVFDFDDTLFHSPKQPNGYKGNWMINIDSLTPPALEKVPNDNKWNMDLVNKALKMCSDPYTYCILLTGRIGNIFEDRIKQLLSQKNLSFDLFELNEFGGDAVKFKVQTINKLTNKIPNLKQILMWEDKEDKLKKFKEQLISDKYDFKIYLVDGTKKVSPKKTFKIKIK